ncbi:MAG: hypothetical protein JNK82_15400 [Myxococcaceae bacterium]|nr:hypothetical protein [Myxococcaceae bacterium]
MNLLVLWLLTAEPVVSTVPCKTVAECWLDEEGKPIARPKAKKGKAVPRGDCGKNLLWLRNQLSCDENVCVAKFVGDKC